MSGFLNSLKRTLIDYDRWKLYIQGLGNTLLISLGALLIGVLLGVVMSLVLYLNKKYDKLKAPTVVINCVLALFRGTPVVLQLMISAYVFLTFLLSVWGGLIVAMIAFGLNSSAYVCEIFRGGLEAVEDGQLEAGKSLGLSTFSIMTFIIFPQAFKKALPPLGNEFITLVKETSVVGYIGIVDITKVANQIQGNIFEAFAPLMVAAFLYLVIVLALTFALKKLEKKFAKSDREGGVSYDRKSIRANSRKA